MKLCPGCKTVTHDNAVRCGLCGRDLSKVATISNLDEASARIKADNLASEKEIQRRSQWERRIWGLGLLGVGVALILFGAWLGSLASIQYPDLVYGFLLIPLGMWFIARGLLGWRAMYRMG